MPDPLASARRRHRPAHRSPAWWPRPRRRGCRGRLARVVGLPLAGTLCLLAVLLVLVTR